MLKQDSSLVSKVARQSSMWQGPLLSPLTLRYSTVSNSCDSLHDSCDSLYDSLPPPSAHSPLQHRL